MRRLLSLDYVLEHSRLPWLPTEPEKIGTFEALGIERQVLPVQVYRGAAGNTRRYFPLELPVALEAEGAVFVFVDPGYQSAKALRSWGTAHRGLWTALRKRCRAVVAVVRTREGSCSGPRRSSGTGCVLASPAPPAGPSPAKWPAARSRGSSVPSSKGTTGRSRSTGISRPGSSGSSSCPGALEDQRRRAAIDCFATWCSTRLPGGWSRTLIGKARCRSGSAHQAHPSECEPRQEIV